VIFSIFSTREDNAAEMANSSFWTSFIRSSLLSVSVFAKNLTIYFEP
jgi:hypothetical protein